MSEAPARGVLFDMDGTLVDSEALHEAVDHDLFAECGARVPAEVFPTFKGRTSLDVFTDVCDRYGSTRTPDQMVMRKRELFAARLREIRLLDGAADLVAELRREGVPVALVTSTERALVTPILTHHGLAFDAVVTADDVERTKPHPEPYRRGAAALGLAGHDCLAVEDATSGIVSARAAGCRVAALTTSFDAPTLYAAGADAVFGTLAEVRAWLTPRLRRPRG